MKCEECGKEKEFLGYSDDKDGEFMVYNCEYCDKEFHKDKDE